MAIKVPRFGAESDQVFFDRFKREEEIGKRLDHPGVMKVFDDEERSRVYMVMEWVDGQLLRKVLTDEKKLAPERALRIALGICAALEYIHSQGAVHRDLKPENIMVNAEDQIKVIDFGIASNIGSRRLPNATNYRLENAAASQKIEDGSVLCRSRADTDRAHAPACDHCPTPLKVIRGLSDRGMLSERPNSALLEDGYNSHP